MAGALRRYEAMYALPNVPSVTIYVPVVLLLNCGGPKSLGGVCTADSECGEGLGCLDFDVHPQDAGCVTKMKTCSKACTTDADCAGLRPGSNVRCATGCGVAQFCVSLP